MSGHGDSKVVRESKSKKNLNLLTFVICRPTKKQKEVQMNNITLEIGQEEGFVFDIGGLMEELERLGDPRKARGKRYSLSFLLVVILLAKLAGEDTPKGIAEWLKLRRRQIVTAFNSQRDSIPAYNTVRRTLAETISESELQQSFLQYLHQSYGGQQSILVALDGKTLRGTIPKGKTRGVHLLAAYLPEEGIVLMQVAVESKENELTAAPGVLSRLDLKGRVVCGDAMFTQRDLSVQIVGQGGDYVWFAKDNQKQLQEDVSRFFEPPRKAKGWHIAQLPQTTAGSTEKAHGRLEQRVLTLMTDETNFIDWPALQQVFKLDRRVICCRTGEISKETVYGITSLSPERCSADQLLKWTRSYWGIENGLHYRRDKTLREDSIRMSDDKQAEVMAIMNNFIVGLTRKLGFSNLASARRHFDAQLNLKLASST
jgi:predicted transposase YbfD/YdcC